MINFPPMSPPDVPKPDKTDPLQQAARELETVFLAEMLKTAGMHKTPDMFGGGAGEDQFQSLLIRAQAEQMVQSGGIGLAESLYQALKDR
ncbi:MAG: flagellar biosynthesis protein FlgJ [Rhodobacteraceae bacterium]|nr:flagellar biosynthesis protein FlgJ [Paracoccaceae bacterium]